MLADCRPAALPAGGLLALVFANARAAAFFTGIADALMLAYRRPSALGTSASAATVRADARATALDTEVRSSHVWTHLAAILLSRDASETKVGDRGRRFLAGPVASGWLSGLVCVSLLGLGGLGSIGLRSLTHPAASNASRPLRTLPLVQEWSRAR